MPIRFEFFVCFEEKVEQADLKFQTGAVSLLLHHRAVLMGKACELRIVFTAKGRDYV